MIAKDSVLFAFPLKFRKEARMFVFTLFLLSIVLEVPATAIRQEKELKTYKL